MNVIPTEIPDVLILEPKVFGDERGFFFESYNKRVFEEIAGIRAEFVQDNHSNSIKNVLRGLHYQIRRPQGKLVRVVVGEVYDVALDIRETSRTFGKWVGERLSAENRRTMWVPAGFAHGFLVLSDYAEFIYKTTDYWVQDCERCICWNDPDLAITWPIDGELVLSDKDKNGVAFARAEKFA